MDIENVYMHLFNKNTVILMLCFKDVVICLLVFLKQLFNRDCLKKINLFQRKQ